MRLNKLSFAMMMAGAWGVSYASPCCVLRHAPRGASD